MSLSVASSGDVIAAAPDSTAAAATAAVPSTDASSSNGAEAPAGSAAAGAAAVFQLAGAGWREQAAQMGAAFLRVLQVRLSQAEHRASLQCMMPYNGTKMPAPECYSNWSWLNVRTAAAAKPPAALATFSQ
jgi:hypothetical protein